MGTDPPHEAAEGPLDELARGRVGKARCPVGRPSPLYTIAQARQLRKRKNRGSVITDDSASGHQCCCSRLGDLDCG